MLDSTRRKLTNTVGFSISDISKFSNFHVLKFWLSPAIGLLLSLFHKVLITHDNTQPHVNGGETHLYTVGWIERDYMPHSKARESEWTTRPRPINVQL